MMNKKYDFLIVGCGLSGSVLANLLKHDGYNILVIEKRNHIGGNCYDERKDGILVHKYGPHIFHTSDDEVWSYICKYTKFNDFVLRVKSNLHGKIVSFPINLMTLNQMFGIKTPSEAVEYFNSVKEKIENPQNFEEEIISKIGRPLYNTFYKDFTQKCWGISPTLLDASVAKRLPIRYVIEDNYFNDNYQGIPLEGYTKVFEKILDGVEVKLNIDYFNDRKYFDSLSNMVIFTGEIDKYYDYKYGKLDYVGRNFIEESYDSLDYQGCIVMNYPSFDHPYTRIIEHKFFYRDYPKNTIISKEYYSNSGEPYYPMLDSTNQERYKKYLSLSKKDFNNVRFIGRLANYKYFDMDDCIKNSIDFYKSL